MIYKVDHMVITTAEIKKCVGFYVGIGFNAKDVGNRWEFFSGDFKINVHIKGNELEPKAKNVQTGSADLCFEINEKMQDYIKKLSKNNIAIELGIVKRHGVKGEMQSIYLRDPDGNLVEICSYE